MNLELDNNKIVIINDFLQENDYKNITYNLCNSSYRSESKSSLKVDPHGHWVLNFVSGENSTSDNIKDIFSFIKYDDIKNVWTYIQKKYNLEDKILLRCYSNAYTYGTEGYPHTDSQRKDEWTIVLFMNDEWSINWAGELVFFSNDEIIKAVLPKKNTAVIFPSHMIHVARSVSRICYQVRRTLMFKFKNKNI